MNKSAIILGAGPIGLVTAWHLLKDGWDVKIYEKGSNVGGMCRSWNWNDFILDTGPHIFHTPKKEMANLWENNFSHLMQKGVFWCKNVTGDNFDNFWDYPLSWESISEYPKELKRQILSEISKIDQTKKNIANNYNEYIENLIGPTLRKLFFEKYPEKVWGIPTSQMTADWAPKRIEFREKRTPFYYKEWAAVGKYGTGSVYNEIKEKIIKLGGKIFLNKEVVDIEYSGFKLKTIKFNKGSKINIKNEDVVISSLPITLTSILLGKKSNLKFRGICSVYIALNKKTALPKNIHWLYYGNDKIDFNRVSEAKKMTKYVAPKNKTYLTIETTFSKKDEFDSLLTSEMHKRILDQALKTNLFNKKDVLDITSNKEYFVYPVQYVGYQKDLSNTMSFLSKFNNFYSIGTGGEYNYADSQVIFHKAIDLASNLSQKENKLNQTIKFNYNFEFNKEVLIGSKKIGDQNKTYIIAEVGLNHNGSVDLAKQLIKEAKIKGCDAVKLQTFTKDSRVSKKYKGANYAEEITGLEENMNDMFNRLVINFKDQKKIFSYARKIGIEIFSTPFDFESVDFLESMNVKAYKIASMDITNLPLIKYVASKNKPIIISTGMSNLGEVEDAINQVKETGNKNLIILHCNSSYPSTPKDMNLKLIDNYKKIFNLPVGLSDHTIGLKVSKIAITLNANVIERHFTLNKFFEGPDHILSSEPDEMKELVDASFEIPEIVGKGQKNINSEEYFTLNSQRKCIYAKLSLKKGQKITLKHISIKGPGGGILPKYLDLIIGKKIKNDVKEDFPITWDDLIE